MLATKPTLSIRVMLGIVSYPKVLKLLARNDGSIVPLGSLKTRLYLWLFARVCSEQRFGI